MTMTRNRRTLNCCIPIQDDSRDRPEMVSLTSNSVRGFLQFARIADELPDDTLKSAVARGNIDRCRAILDDYDKKDGYAYIKENLLLHEAIKNDSLLRILLHYIGDQSDVLYIKNEDGNTALHCAVEEKRLECCEALMSHEPNTLVEKSSTKIGNTPLHLMVKTNYIDGCVKAMEYIKPGHINFKNKKHYTAVQLASQESYTHILKLLLLHLGNPTGMTNHNYTPLHYAAINGSTESVSLLLEQMPDRNIQKKYIDSQTKDNSTALMFAAKKGFTSCVKLLLKEADVGLFDKTGYSALHYAAKKGSENIVQLLIEKGSDLNLKTQKGETVLQLAAAAGSKQCLTYLLSKTSVIDDPQNLLKMAIVKNHTNCLIVLLSHDIIKKYIDYQFPEKINNTLLHLSLKNSNYKITRELLKSGANKAILNGRNEYPLHLAAAQKPLESRYAEDERIEECKSVMSYSHDYVNSINCDKETPLHLAAKSGNIEMVRSLLKKGAKVMEEDCRRHTPIHVAAGSGNDAVLKMLLRSASQLTDVAAMVPHPLHLAAQFGHKTCCKIIIKYFKMAGNLTVIDDNDLFPVDVALNNNNNNNNNEVVRYLLGEMKFQPAQFDFGCRIHAIFKKSLKQGNKQLLEIIIESEWFRVCFDNYYCAHAQSPDPVQCLSFSRLIETYPGIACLALDRHITVHDNEQDETHSYVPFEYIYYNEDDNGPQPAFNSLPNASDVVGSLRSTSKEFSNVVWGHDHPLMVASKGEHTQILTHKLTKSWMNQKYVSYTQWLLYLYVLLDLATAVFTTVMFSYLWNDHHLMTSFHGANRSTISDVWYNSDPESTMDQQVVKASDHNCSQFEGANQDQTSPVIAGSALWEDASVCAITNLQANTPYVITLQIIVTFFWVINILLEGCIIAKTNIFYNIFGITRIVCLVFVLYPYSGVEWMLGMKPDLAWQCGVAAVLLCILNFAGTLNKVPTCRVFMPLTRSFIFSYVRVIGQILIIVAAFAVSFHFLLMEKPAFKTIAYSAIKTLVWMLGDLGYDDTFLDPDSPVIYPIQTNIIFVLFVTTIGGLIFNLILRDPTDHLSEIKEKSSFYQADSLLRLHLLIDDCVPFFRRKYTKNMKAIIKKDSSQFYLTLIKSKKNNKQPHNKNVAYTDVEHETSCSDNDSQLAVLIQKLDSQKEDINHIIQAIAALKGSQDS